MKTRIFTTAMMLCLISVKAISQFGVQAGGLMSKGSAKVDGLKIEADSKAGFTAGIAYRMPLGSVFSFQPELNFLQRGTKQKGSDLFDDYEYEHKSNINYIELPLYFLYTGSEGYGFIGGLGPSINYGISGKWESTEDGVTEKGDVEFGEDEGLNRVFVALNAMVGYQFNSGFNVNAFANQSITNISNGDNGKSNFFTFGLRVGYFFSGGDQYGSAKLKKSW